MYYTHEINRDINLTIEELEEANAFESERRHEASLANEPWDDIEAALVGGAMLRVNQIENGFEIVLRLKNAERSKIRLYTRLYEGGLFDENGYPVLKSYEFSMHRYQGSHTNMRAATEYVRRKLTKELERVRHNRKALGI